MIKQEEFIRILQQEDVDFFCGVPDSYLNAFNNYLKTHMDMRRHVITANEGNAIALAAGHHFATGKLSLVYMQNSGLGNCVNPLVSLADAQVYSVPMVLLIGWRGEPGTEDGKREQHITQGRITLPLLDSMDIPYRVLSEERAGEDARWAACTARQLQRPAALIAPGKTMTEKKKNEADDTYPMSREEAIAVILDHLPADSIYGATTGRATRELFCQRQLRGQTHGRDFLNLGSMGHASSVMLGMALARPDRRFVCLDGDAAALMHMGSLAVSGALALPNYMHIVLNNGAHESVGGQPSVGHTIDFTGIAESCGFYSPTHLVTNREELIQALRQCVGSGRASFLDVRIHSGLRSDLGAITMNSQELKQELMQELRR